MSSLKPSFLDSLEKIVELTKTKEEVSIQEIFFLLEERGSAALLVVFSLPCCLPVQIPGFSTPFGLLLAFLGFRLLIAKKPWWPKPIWEKKFSSKKIALVITKTKKFVEKLQKFTKPRFNFLGKHPLCQRFNSLLILILGLGLALPLPLPLSNLLTALPILAFGLGLLEDDGVMILVGYFLTLLCFSAFTLLLFFGKAYLTKFLSA